MTETNKIKKDIWKWGESTFEEEGRRWVEEHGKITLKHCAV